MFEMVYKQQISAPQPYMGMNLTVRGTKIQKSPKNKRKRKPSIEPDLQLSISCTNSGNTLIQDLSTMLAQQSTELKADSVSLVETCSSNSAIPSSLSTTSQSGSDEDSTDSDESFQVSVSDKKVSVHDISTQTVDLANQHMFNISNFNVQNLSKKQQGQLYVKPISEKSPSVDCLKNKKKIENKESKKISHHAKCCKPIERTSPRFIRTGSRYSNTNHLKLWKQSTERAQTNDLLNDWKQKIDRTRSNCEEMLKKLKVLRDKDVNKKTRKGINWKAENVTVSEIVKKLGQHQKKEFLEHLPVVRESAQRKSISDHSNPGTPKSRSPSTSPFGNRHVLPHIKDKNMSAENNNLFAVGLSLQYQNSNYTKDKLLMPLGSEHCLPLGSFSNTLASS